MSENQLIKEDAQELAQLKQDQLISNLQKYHNLKREGYILFETITGSMAHGTNTETSDIDKTFVYILPKDDIYGVRYEEQIKIHKDYMGYEIRRFLELLRKNNPTVLELLNSPEDCILYKNPVFDILVKNKDKFITKESKNAFVGYAKQQIAKAKGLDKKQNWEKGRVVRKTPLDMCHVIIGYDSKPFPEWLQENGYEQLFCGISSVDRAPGVYAVFYDQKAHNCFSEKIPLEEREKLKSFLKSNGETVGLGYKGAAFEDSNDIRKSNIPKEERNNYVCHMYYNKDAYAKHCKEYKEYQEWLEHRNESRWVEIEGHGQQIDGKNMMHCMRLILIGKEIAEGKGINIRRPDAQDLLKIRRGLVSLQDLLDKSDDYLREMIDLYETSNLPLSVPEEFIHNMLVDVRNQFYTFSNREEEKFLNYCNREPQNKFVIEKYGELSELWFVIGQCFVERIKELNNDSELLVDEPSEQPWVKLLNESTWPRTTNKVTNKIEPVSFENFEVLKVEREYIRFAACGKNQNPVSFEIAMWGEELVVINTTQLEEMQEGIGQEKFLNQIGVKLDE